MKYVLNFVPAATLDVTKITSFFIQQIFEPSLEVNGYYGSRTVRCLQFNDDILAAGYYGGEVCVWDINTTELVVRFNTFTKPN